MEVREARFAELSPATLYRILRLRAAVFVVEQECAYLDIDGLDMDPTAVHLWIDADPAAPTVGAAARVFEDAGGWTIGRVVTAQAARGRGWAAALIDRALDLVPPGAPVELKAQSHLAAWYARWGFTGVGEPFLDDGILHLPMRRPGGDSITSRR